MDLVTIKTYPTAMEAHVDRILLEERGITVFVDNENHELSEDASWPASGVRLQVAAADVSAASEILSGDR